MEKSCTVYWHRCGIFEMLASGSPNHSVVLLQPLSVVGFIRRLVSHFAYWVAGERAKIIYKGTPYNSLNATLDEPRLTDRYIK